MVLNYSLYNELSDVLLSARELPAWAHPEVHYWYPEWRKIRDCIAGERTVKEMGEQYLPALEGMPAQDYASFVERATYHNFTARTVNALGGSILRRRPKVRGVPDNRLDLLDSFTKDGLPFWNFASYIAYEVVSMGRLGILVDLPDVETTQPRPYTVAYTAENILDWDTEMYQGRQRLNYVVLREARRIDPRATDTDGSTQRYAFAPRYRVLRINEAGFYQQEIYEDDENQINFQLDEATLKSVIVPQFRGRPINYIPFCVIGPALSTANCEKPPMQDIAALNISHYRSYAYLEHGRFFTGFPIYYAELPMTGQSDGMEFRIGSSNVWLIPPGSKAGMIEMNGQGLKFLTEALDVKEAQAAQIGGRMMGIRGAAASMSDNQLTMQERNEQSVLLQVTLAMDDRVTKIMRWMMIMSGVSERVADEISVEFNKDFLFNSTGARELRAVHMMYMDSAIPVEVLFSYLKRAEVIEDWMEIADFKALMANIDEFPNQPDAEARMEGFPDKQSQIDQENAEEEREAQERARQDAIDQGLSPGDNADAQASRDNDDDEDDNGS